jgi:hypothetical protein
MGDIRASCIRYPSISPNPKSSRQYYDIMMKYNTLPYLEAVWQMYVDLTMRSKLIGLLIGLLKKKTL